MEDRPDREARSGWEEKVATQLSVLTSLLVGRDRFSTGSAVLTTAVWGKYLKAKV